MISEDVRVNNGFNMRCNGKGYSGPLGGICDGLILEELELSDDVLFNQIVRNNRGVMDKLREKGVHPAVLKNDEFMMKFRKSFRGQLEKFREGWKIRDKMLLAWLANTHFDFQDFGFLEPELLPPGDIGGTYAGRVQRYSKL